MFPPFCLHVAQTMFECSRQIDDPIFWREGGRRSKSKIRRPPPRRRPHFFHFHVTRRYGYGYSKPNPYPYPSNYSSFTMTMMDNLVDDMESQFSLGGWGEVRTPAFDSYYVLQEKLQSGSYGTVFVGVHKIRKQKYAVKVVDRR